MKCRRCPNTLDSKFCSLSRLSVVVLFLVSGPLSVPAIAQTSTPAPQTGTQMERGLAALQRGAFEQAVENLLEAAGSYERQRRFSEQSEALVQLSLAYQAIGQYKKALKSLQSAVAAMEQTDNKGALGPILASLGNAYMATGQLDSADRMFTQGLELARQQRNLVLSASLLNNQGNLFAIEKKYPEAKRAYAESLTLARQLKNDTLSARALINAAQLAVQVGDDQEALERIFQASDVISQLGPSHEKAYMLITLGLALDDLQQKTSGIKNELILHTAGLYQDAMSVSEGIKDARAASYGYGYLGRLYERERRYQEAMQLTRQAIQAAQQVNAPESLYRWQWQIGRLLRAQGKVEEAIAAYRRAVYTLQPLRQEMLVSYANTRSAFRESVGPLFFELADLLLQRAALTPERVKYEPYLIEARETTELLKAAELQDYFQDDCVAAAKSRRTTADSVSQTTLVVYPILLPDRTELLVSHPTGMKQFTMPVTSARITEEVRSFRRMLEKRTTREYLPHAQQLYNWLIRPLEPELRRLNINTLVIVPDGSLRTIPLAALHDGKEFLIAKYAVATTPGLDLTDPRPLKRGSVNLISVGVSEAVQGFPALPNVSTEMKAVQGFYGGDMLLNEDFQVWRLEKELKKQQISIVHVASHGKLESDVEKSYILTFDGKMTMDRLDQVVGLFQYRDDPLELLTLSACETAAGDDRAALGLAGIAIKAGAKSALATLWFINDKASSILVEEFYRELRGSSVTKAVALQRAQLKLIKDPGYEHPGYWSPFLLLNNWL
jgi:CHAT domain-containing protein/Tfp pilus assembly protein PilF